MNVLVTGGAGYVGSVTVAALLNRGHEVVVLDHLNTGARQARHVGTAFVQGDIADGEKVAFAVLEHDVEAVIHFACLTKLGSAVEYFERNTAASLSLLKTLLRYGVRKLILSSTATLPGQYETLLIDERTPLIPKDAYRESIYLIERMLHWLNRTQGLSYIGLRYANVAGEAERSVPRRQIVEAAKTHILALELLSDGDAKTYNLSDKGRLSELEL